MDAREAIGEQADDDSRLDPAGHAKSLPDEAGPLRRILQSSRVEFIIDEYEDADRRAGEAQVEYKSRRRRVIIAAAAAALIGALVLALPAGTGSGSAPSQPSDIAAMESPAEPPDDPAEVVASVSATSRIQSLRLALIGVELLLLAFAAMERFRVRGLRPLERWMQERSAAELSRIGLFATVCGSPSKEVSREGELPVLPLLLEYFRRYQVDVQVAYYKGRGEEHEEAARKWVTGGALVAFIVTLAMSLVGAGLLGGNWISVLAIVGVAGPVVVSMQSGLSELNQDERNAVRYRSTLRRLQAHRADLDDVREKVAAGDAAALHAFVTEFNEEISVENRQWLELKHVAQHTVDDDSASGG